MGIIKMVLSIDKKKEIVCELKKNFSTALSTVVASVSGITANSVNQLRKEARSLGVCMRIVPNSLLRRAVHKTSLVFLSDFFVGESVIAFSTKNPSDAARIFVKFSKDYENFKIKGAAFEGKLISTDQIDLLSNLPSFTESMLQFILILKMITVGNLIKLLKELSIHKC